MADRLNAPDDRSSRGSTGFGALKRSSNEARGPSVGRTSHASPGEALNGRLNRSPSLSGRSEANRGGGKSLVELRRDHSLDRPSIKAGNGVGVPLTKSPTRPSVLTSRSPSPPSSTPPHRAPSSIEALSTKLASVEAKLSQVAGKLSSVAHESERVSFGQAALGRQMGLFAQANDKQLAQLGRDTQLRLEALARENETISLGQAALSRQLDLLLVSAVPPPQAQTTSPTMHAAPGRGGGGWAGSGGLFASL